MKKQRTAPASHHASPRRKGALGGCLVAGLTLLLPAAVSAGSPVDGPMMHAADPGAGHAVDPGTNGADHESEGLGNATVLIPHVETWSEYRHQTDETYVDENGETQPVYRLMKPEEGHTYLRIVVDISTDEPQSHSLDEFLLVSSPTAEDRWVAAPLVAFDEQGLPQIGLVTEPAEKVELDLLYEVPQETWTNFYIEVGDRWYGPLQRYLDQAKADEESAATCGFSAESGLATALIW